MVNGELKAWRGWAVGLAMLAGAGSAGGQTINGRVLDAGTGAPVAQARVSALDAESRLQGSATADREGRFTLRLRAPGPVRLRAERTGFQAALTGALDVGPRDAVSVELRMSGQALTIDPLTVTAREGPRRIPALATRGFYDRERRGLGDFLHREDIERGSPIRLSQVLDRVVGTTLIRGRNGDVVVFDRSWGTGMLRNPGDSLCPPRIYLDGIAIATLTVDNVVQPESVEAVELYHGASQIPVQYNDSGAACGVILIWTRMSP